MLPLGSALTPAPAGEGGVVGGVSEASWQAEPRAAGRTGCQLTSLLAPSLPRLSGLPALWLQGQCHPQATSLLLLLCTPSQLHRRIAAPAPVRTEGHSSPVQSRRPSPRPAGLSPATRSRLGAHAGCTPTSVLCSAPLLRGGEGVVFRPSPLPQPGHLSPFFRAGPSSAPFLLNRYNTCATPLPPSPSPLLFFPSPSSQPWPWFTAAKTHTHTLMHKTNCGMFSRFRVRGLAPQSSVLAPDIQSMSTPCGFCSSWKPGLGGRGGDQLAGSHLPLTQSRTHARRAWFSHLERHGAPRCQAEARCRPPPPTLIHSFHRVIHPANVC